MAALPERVAGLEAREHDRDRRVDGHGRTLYGVHGNGGLQADVQQLMLSHNAHVKETAAFGERHTRILTGDGDKDLGLVGDVAVLMRDRENRSKLLWILAAAAAAEGFTLLVLLLQRLAHT